MLGFDGRGLRIYPGIPSRCPLHLRAPAFSTGAVARVFESAFSDFQIVWSPPFLHVPFHTGLKSNDDPCHAFFGIPKGRRRADPSFGSCRLQTASDSPG